MNMNAMKTYDQLLQERQNIEQQIKEARKREMNDAIAQARALIDRYELTEKALFPARRGSARSASSSVAKYRDPVSGKTWTGRGKPPGWIQGQDRQRFAI